MSKANTPHNQALVDAASLDLYAVAMEARGNHAQAGHIREIAARVKASSPVFEAAQALTSTPEVNGSRTVLTVHLDHLEKALKVLGEKAPGATLSSTEAAHG